MTKLMSTMSAFALICLLASPASAQSPICNFFPGLPGCDPPPPGLEDRVEDLEEAVDELMMQIGALQDQNNNQQSAIDALLLSASAQDNRITNNETDIAALQLCADDLKMRVARLEAVIDCTDTICDIGGMNFCIDTDTDDANCGSCGNACAQNEVCTAGACELIVCPDPPQCQDVVLMMDGTCVNFNLSNTTPCDDGQFCTATDICQFGQCVGFGTPCDEGVCNEDTDMCDLPAKAAASSGRARRR